MLNNRWSVSHKLNSSLVYKLMWLILCFGIVQIGTVYANTISNVRLWNSPDNTRVVLDLEQEADYHMFVLHNPDRVVLDIKNTNFKSHIDAIMLAGSGIKQLRHSKEQSKTRLVFDMLKTTMPESFILPPNEEYGYRLVIDLKFVPNNNKLNDFPRLNFKQHPDRKFLVAIDPGHGGEDPGAIGIKYKTHEKAIVLSVAKQLKKIIDSDLTMRAILLRDSDYYVGLRKRMELARSSGADVFISLHADSFNDPKAEGASVYILSSKGASSEAARWLAEKENKSDLIGGVKLEDKGNMLASVLLDLSQTASRTASNDLAESTLQELSTITSLHQRNVQQAGFMVLKSPDVPSILVELGFISNVHGEKELRSVQHQQKLAKALYSGLKTYIAKHPKPIPHTHELAKEQFSLVDNLYG